MRKKQLIVNADDFGMSEGVTDGIITSHLQGIVTSTSMMANMPDTARAANLLKKITSLDVGIHLNLTQGRPVLPPERVQSLVNSAGEFLSESELISKLKRFRVSPAEIEAEFSAQIQKIFTAGIRPSHINSHHHVHVYPLSAWAFNRAIMQYGIKRIRAVSYYVIYNADANRSRLTGQYIKSWIRVALRNMYKTCIKQCFIRGITSANYRVEPALVSPQDRHLDLNEQWVKLLSNLPTGIFEIACHPAYEDQESKSVDDWSDIRKQDLDTLTHRDIKDAVRRYHVELISFKNL